MAAAVPNPDAALIAALPKPVLVAVDMPPEAVTKCLGLAAAALVAAKVEKDQAAIIKKALEVWNGALWHVVVGTSFGASVAHEVHAFLLFRIGKVNILAFQSFDEAALVSSGPKVARAVQQVEKEDEGGEDGGDS